MRDKPNACYECKCPLAITCQCTHLEEIHFESSNCTYVNPVTNEPCKCNEFRSKGRGFVLGSGNPNTAKFMFVFEAPGKEDVGFRVKEVSGRSFLGTKEDVDKELQLRMQSYPQLEKKFITNGAPIVGATGTELEMWGFPKSNIERKEIFIDNVIRCLPPVKKKSAYPTGDEKKGAEQCCRMWDRLDQFKPDVALITLHPAGILKEITPLPLQIADLRKVKDFHTQGLRPLVLLGGKAAQAFLRYGSNATKWRGHYERLKEGWVERYKELFKFKAKIPKKPGPKKGAKLAKQQNESFKVWDHLFKLSDKAVKTKRRNYGKKEAEGE